MLVHDCDLRAALHAKRLFDAAGHYSREDVLGDGAAPAAPGADGGTFEAGEPGLGAKPA